MRFLIGNLRNGMDYWMVTTVIEEPGINGGLSKRISGQIGISNTINVSSLDEYSKKIVEKGGQLIIPKMAIPKIEWFAQCTDIEGNIFGIIEMDKKSQ